MIDEPMKLSVTKQDIAPKLLVWNIGNSVSLFLFVPLKKIDINLDFYIPNFNDNQKLIQWKNDVKTDTIKTIRELLKSELKLKSHPDPKSQEINEIMHNAEMKKIGGKIKTMLKYLDDKDLIVSL